MPKTIELNTVRIKEVIVAEHTDDAQILNGELQPAKTYYAINAWVQYLDTQGHVMLEERVEAKRDEFPKAFETVLKTFLTKTRDRIATVKDINSAPLDS